MTRAYICTHSSLIREVHFGDRFSFTCDGCEESGYGTCYACINQSCDYHLHTSCQSASPKMSHPFFKQGHFVLDKTKLPPTQPPNNLCVACGTSVLGWRYVLTINGAYTTVFLHPCCMALPHQNLHQKLEKSNCVHCPSTGAKNEGINSWAYVNNNDEAVHIKCMKDVIHKDWERRSSYVRHEHGETQYGGSTTRDRGVDHDGIREDRHPLKLDHIFVGLKMFAYTILLACWINWIRIQHIHQRILQKIFFGDSDNS